MDKIFKTTEKWALGADNLQWILYRNHNRKKHPWSAVSFVSSEKKILERCMRDKGVPPDVAEHLLEGLPDTFKAWKLGAASGSVGFFGPPFSGT